MVASDVTQRAVGLQSDSALTVLVHTSKTLGAQVADCVARRGFTLEEWMVLDAVERNSGCSMSEISAASGCHGASLTRTVDKLVMNSCVYRKVSQADRRKVEVFISDHGRAVHGSLREELRELEESLGDVLAEMGIGRSTLLELCDRLRGLDAAGQTRAQ